MARLKSAGGLALAASVMLAGFAVFIQGAWIPAKAQLAQVLLERAWTRAQAGDATPQPWPWADTWPVAAIDVPRLNERAIVLAEAGGEAMAFAPAHLTQTPLPGEAGVSVIAAHRDTHFQFLQHVEAGDRIEVTSPDGVRRSFVARSFQIVHHANSGIIPDGGPARLALVTCYPFGAVTASELRYIVWADAISAGDTDDAAAGVSS